MSLKKRQRVKNPDHIYPEEIGPLLGKGVNYFARKSVRDRLNQQGFPRPLSRGVWLRQAVLDFRDAIGRSRADDLRQEVIAEADLDLAIARTLQHLGKKDPKSRRSSP